MSSKKNKPKSVLNVSLDRNDITGLVVSFIVMVFVNIAVRAAVLEFDIPTAESSESFGRWLVGPVIQFAWLHYWYRRIKQKHLD